MNMTRKEKVGVLLEVLRPIRREMVLGSAGENSARVTPAQFGVLMLLNERGEASVKDIAGALRISSSAATQLVNGLIKGGHVRREASEKDRRAVALSLSPKTKAKLDNLRRAALQKTVRLFDALSDHELDEYIALNRKIAQRFIRT